MKILIRFGDNDFANTLRAFGELLILHPHVSYHPDALTKEQIADWWNRVAPVLYEMVQNRGWDFPTKESLKLTADYLQISPDVVFINEEADKQMEDWNSWGNGAALFVEIFVEKPNMNELKPRVLIV